MTLPSWSHCIPTLNRIDILELAVRLSLCQTCPPSQIIIVDASDRVDQHRARIEAAFAAHAGPKPELLYLASPIRSLTCQRNQALDHATGDILVMTDDDTLMHEDCVENLLRVYAADPTGDIACIGMTDVPEVPAAARAALGLEGPSAASGATGAGRNAAIERKAGKRIDRLKQRLRDNRLVHVFTREVLMMAMDRMFVPYDPPDRRHVPSSPPAGHVSAHLPGYGMSVRRAVALAEPFNGDLLAYCPLEDLDATYRWGRHGQCVLLSSARVHHYEVAGSRVTRRQATMLGITNMAYFMRCNAALSLRDRARFYLYAARRVLGETLKDLLTGRFSLPQARGAVAAIPVSARVFSMPQSGLRDWYVQRQREILQSRPAPG